MRPLMYVPKHIAGAAFSNHVTTCPTLGILSGLGPVQGQWNVEKNWA